MPPSTGTCPNRPAAACRHARSGGRSADRGGPRAALFGLSLSLLVGLLLAAGIGLATTARAAGAGDRPADPLAAAVIASLASQPRSTPAELLDVAIRAADVEAWDLAVDSVDRLGDALEKAGDGRREILADLGEATDPADLRRLERVLVDRQADGVPIARGIRDATALRRREPARLAAAAAALADDSAAARREAAARLGAVGLDALPALVDVLQAAVTEPGAADPAVQRAGTIARGLVRGLGTSARQPLLAWLAGPDVARWPGVIEALAATDAADRDVDFAEYLLAPALVADTPPAARAAALRLLRRIEHRCRTAAGEPAGPLPPDTATAVAMLTQRLDCVLTAAGLPAADRLLVEPVTDPANAVVVGGTPAGGMSSSGMSSSGTVERFVFDPQARRIGRVNVPPRVARAQEAMHLARDLTVLGTDDAAAVRLVLLTRLEAALLSSADDSTPPRLPVDRLVAALTGPGGFDFAAAADVLDMAAARGMLPAAAAAAWAIEAAQAATGPRPEPLPPRARGALVRALEVPDAGVRFEAARALALAAGDTSFRGSSRVIEVLLHAATATGEDVAVVAHHDTAVRQQLATDLSRFGYRVEQVATGREAILATRALADTVLVLVGARSVRPTPLETVQLIQRQPLGDVPPVLVLVDPLDDDARGKFLTRLLLTFGDMPCVGVTDRLDSLFAPTVDPVTGEAVGPPRFHDRLAQIAGPGAVAPAARAARAAGRRSRAAEALALLARLGRRGHDVSAAETTARLALQSPAAASPADLFAPAVAVLATIGTSEAQRAVLRELDAPGLPEPSRRLVVEAFAASVDRYGLLLDGHALSALQARYNSTGRAVDRAVAAAVLDVIHSHLRKACPLTADAAHSRPTR